MWGDGNGTYGGKVSISQLPPLKIQRKRVKITIDKLNKVLENVQITIIAVRKDETEEQKNQQKINNKMASFRHIRNYIFVKMRLKEKQPTCKKLTPNTREIKTKRIEKHSTEGLIQGNGVGYVTITQSKSPCQKKNFTRERGVLA